jgi:hypothetical protein
LLAEHHPGWVRFLHINIIDDKPHLLQPLKVEVAAQRARELGVCNSGYEELVREREREAGARCKAAGCSSESLRPRSLRLLATTSERSTSLQVLCRLSPARRTTMGSDLLHSRVDAGGQQHSRVDVAFCARSYWAEPKDNHFLPSFTDVPEDILVWQIPALASHLDLRSGASAQHLRHCRRSISLPVPAGCPIGCAVPCACRLLVLYRVDAAPARREVSHEAGVKEHDQLVVGALQAAQKNTPATGDDGRTSWQQKCIAAKRGVLHTLEVWGQ